jgi:hypothetical protein
MNYILENWESLFAIVGIACSLATAIVSLTPSVKDDSVVATVVKWANWLSVVNPKAPKA